MVASSNNYPVVKRKMPEHFKGFLVADHERATVTFEAYSESRIKLINEYIDNSLNRYRQSVSQRFSLLIEAMRYSLEGGGKRLRPMLVLATPEALGLPAEHVLTRA